MIFDYKISIIVPCFNANSTIANCLNSIIFQNYKNFEIIVIDGLSTDETVNTVKGLLKNVPHVIISEKDNGIYDAINKGIDTSTGDYLIVLGADDVFFDHDVLNRVFSHNFKYADFIYGNVIFKSTGATYDGKFNVLKLLTKNICHQAIFHHKSVYEKLGKYDTKYKALADQLFNIKCFESGDISILYVDETIAIYNDNGFSSTFIDKTYWDDLSKNLGTFCSTDLVDYNRYKEILSEKDQQISSLNCSVAEQAAQIATLKLELANVLRSISWKITKPIRFFRRNSEIISRRIWNQIPVSQRSKQRVKSLILNTMRPLIRNTNSGNQTPEHSYALPNPLIYLNQAQTAYVPLLNCQSPKVPTPVRLIAFFLPQFHSIPENDSWWGDDFTEWTNVRPAIPQFAGHYQPHVPGELGYYNLLDHTVQQRQVELAKLYGVGGFCFYFYWFAGKRLLEQPIENYLNDRQCDLPFCLCWANENWSRRWDGRDSEILISQKHSPDDDIAFISHISKYLRDERYIRIDGRPLLLVYWPGQLPSPKKTAKRWRSWCRDNGIGEIYLAYTQSFETINPSKYGFDAAVEFPPNNMSPPVVTQHVRPLSDDFSGTVYDWQHFVRRSRNYHAPDYTLFRGVCPSWDNTARRKNKGTVLLNSSPRDYQEWLSNAIQETCERIKNTEERLIFVNAWNEWAEGAHLEPDQRFGYAWLDATRKALLGSSAEPERTGRRIIVVSHDAHPHGAQFLALGMVRALVQELGIQVEVVLLGSGRLASEFASIATVHDLSSGSSKDATVLANSLVKRGFTRSIINTTVSGWLVPIFKKAGIESICLIHELPGVIEDMGLENNAKEIAESAKAVIFPAQIVADGFSRFATLDPERQIIRPQGLYRRNKWRFDKPGAKDRLCNRLHLSKDSKIVLTVGYADHRKGIDLFVNIALTILSKRQDIHFVWVGHWEQIIQQKIESQLMDNPHRGHLHFVGYDPETAMYHAASDVYALTSREDPFPNVVLESFNVAVPVVAFAETGGAAQLVQQLGGMVVPAEDTAIFAESICHLLDDSTSNNNLGHIAQSYVDINLSFRKYMFDLCSMLKQPLPKVSVIVPNFNYAHHIKHRLDSILRQTVPFYELIILDDASTDDSLRSIEEWLSATGSEAQIIQNSCNSGNVFAQWKKGISMATGDFIWIAEADDLSDPDFLETVLLSLRSENTVLSYCESKQINDSGAVVAENYGQYLSTVSSSRWMKPYSNSGKDEIRSCLAVMNTIPNVSAVVFKRETVSSVFEQHFTEIARFSKAGDWVVYLRTLELGDIAYSPHAANLHRRHDGSVIAGSSTSTLYQEIQQVQQTVAKTHDLDKCTHELAAKYLATLRQQFGLNK